MTLAIYSPALDELAFPPEEFLGLAEQEGTGPSRDSAESSQQVIRIGVFFDGTNNCKRRDYDLDSSMLPPPVRTHTNIVRLYLAHPGQESAQAALSSNNYRYYVPGVGAPFPEVGEFAESQDGKAFAKGGQARILWALMQVCDAVHRAVCEGQPLWNDGEIQSLLKDYERCVEHQHGSREDPSVMHRDWLQSVAARLARRFTDTGMSRHVWESMRVNLSVFGFSRGAVAARAFCCWFDDLLLQGRLAGVQAEVSFLGLFDSVASVGLPASVKDQLGLWMVDGHAGWAGEALGPLPAFVKKVVHMVAAHELRMNFPLTRVGGDSGAVKEWLFPGVHSDIGGGYAPGFQGRSRAGYASLLSQIPLLYMYREALLAGVPLLAMSRMSHTLRQEFAVDRDLALAFNNYLRALQAKPWSVYEQLIRKHMALYYKWRAAMTAAGLETVSAHALSEQDRKDLEESELRLRGDLHLLRLRGSPDALRTDRGGMALSPQERANANQMAVNLAEAGTQLSSWERWVLELFQQGASPEGRLSSEVQFFFQHYVHDSLASFYLVGPGGRHDREVLFLEMCRKLASAQALNGFERRLYELNTSRAQHTIQALREGRHMSATAAELRFPVVTDDDAADLRRPLLRLLTATRREGGGYLRQRSVF